MRRIAFWLSLVFIITIPMETVFEYPVFGSISRMVGILVAVFWLGVVLATGRFRKPSIFHITLFGFVIWNALSLFWSRNAENTVDRLNTWLQW